jgi:bidirectional [NiFe] hydrogenase diaphorase subunit
VLHTAQEAFGFLSDDLLVYVAHQLKLPLSWVYGVATFYHFFTLTPQGQHNCIVCMGTACYVKRAAEIVAALQQEFQVMPAKRRADGALQPGDGALSWQCGLAPVLVLDGDVLPRETPETHAGEGAQTLAEINGGASTCQEWRCWSREAQNE